MKLIPTLFGGAKLPLKPNGPAPFAQPDEVGRRALFWRLKRNTSYSAIADNARLWDAFARDFEQYLRSGVKIYDTDTQSYKYIVDTQLAYERGLAALRQGDRSVFSRTSSEGWLGKLYTHLTERRYEWWGKPEEIAEVQGWPLQLVQHYYIAHNAAMSSGRDSSYAGLGPPENSAIYVLQRLLRHGIDTSLPEPRWDVYFAPGKRAPKDGIYEMVNAQGHIVGSQSYFIKGEAVDDADVAEFGPDANGERTNSFFWRLIWEDTRYKDGQIPTEEQFYPSPSESLVSDIEPDAQSLRCEAGGACPREGRWFTPAGEGSRYFKYGEVMPEIKSDYGRTIWLWIE